MNHTPDGYCEYYSLWSRDVELYKRARLAELRAAGGTP